MNTYYIDILEFIKSFNLSDLKDIFEILFWLGTLCVAFFGLKTWRKQLKGTIEYDIARKILLSIYRLRYGVEKIRNPFMSSGELSFEDESLTNEALEIKKLQLAYNARFTFFSNEKQKIFVDILEAEVLWGAEIKVLVYEFLIEIRELEMAVEDTIRIRQMSTYERNEPYWKERSKEIHEIIYSKSLSGINLHHEDNFGQKLQNKIIEIESYMLPYLNRK